MELVSYLKMMLWELRGGRGKGVSKTGGMLVIFADLEFITDQPQIQASRL